MRSEKEIREKIDYLKNNPLQVFAGNGFPEQMAKGMEWTLEGPPRYSVEELEKIDTWGKNLSLNHSFSDEEYECIKNGWAVENGAGFIEAMTPKFFRDCPDKVREILAEGKT